MGAPRKRAKAAGPSAEIEGFVDDYLPALLAQASALISSEFHKVARRNKLSVSEWRVLATLASRPADRDCSMGQLAQITLNKQPTLTRLLDRMVAAGHVERHDDEADRRITLVRVSRQGRALAEKLIGQALEHERRVLEPFGEAAGASLKRTLKRLIELHRAD